MRSVLSCPVFTTVCPLHSGGDFSLVKGRQEDVAFVRISPEEVARRAKEAQQRYQQAQTEYEKGRLLSLFACSLCSSCSSPCDLSSRFVTPLSCSPG